MPTNVYFSQKVKSEQNLYEDIVIESLKMYGQDVYYLPREIITEDAILNEDVESNFNDAYMVEMYIENIEGFEGEGNILAKFGVEIRDQATFIVSKRRWEQLIGYHNNGINSIRPSEGDLIYIPMSKSIFEIRFVEHELPFYQLSNLPVYKLQCELFEYSGETIMTGFEDIDRSINQVVSYQTVLKVNNGNAIDFVFSEEVRQQIGATSEYISGVIVYTEPLGAGRELRITDWTTSDGKVHEFIINKPLVGKTSGATWNVFEVNEIADSDLANDRAFVSDAQSRNQEFESAADGIIDFSESNPFGEIGS